MKGTQKDEFCLNHYFVIFSKKSVVVVRVLLKGMRSSMKDRE